MKKLILVVAILFGFAANATVNTKAVVKKEVYSDDVSMLCKLIQKGDLDAIKSMVEAGADVNKKSKGMTPLMYAARYNKVEILKYLISKGAKLKTKSDKGYTALKYAEISKATDTQVALKEALETGK